jgi:hypothetical protein
MNVKHYIGSRKDKIFVAAFEVGAAEIGSVKIAGLQSGSRRTIKQKYALG